MGIKTEKQIKSERIAELKSKIKRDEVHLSDLESRRVRLRKSKTAPRRTMRNLLGRIRSAKNRLRKDRSKLNRRLKD